MQQQSGIVVPSQAVVLDVERKANFLEKAQDKLDDTKFIDNGNIKLQQINEEIEKEAMTDAKSSFLETSEHLMKVN